MMEIDIPFGAKDSELKGWRYKIPEGYTAEIKDGEIIVKSTMSEDERMEKAIVDALLSHSNSINLLSLRGYQIEDVKAWLEKQKEQKPIARENDFVSKPKTSREILKHYLVWAENSEEDCPYTWKELADAIKDGIAALEQKPAERSETKINGEPISAENQSVNIPLAEWSDTKELVFKDICKHLEEEGYNGWVVLLNALRNGEFQPKPEWSEEEEKMLEEIINHIYTTSVQRIPARPGSDIGKSWIKFLKSLRPRWKPSEEQMNALKDAIILIKDVKITETLMSLRVDLKKLM